MAIKGGDLIHVANKILIDRAQTAGPGQVSINREKIYELGNYFSLASIADTPDLTFTVDSFDASAEFESLILNKVFSTANATQVVTINGGPTGGDFTLTYKGQTTGAIAYNAAASAVATALIALSNVGPGEFTATGAAGGPYTITAAGALLAAGNVGALTASASGLTGGTSPSITITGSEGVVMADGTALKPASSLPIDVVSAFKPGFQASNAYDVVGSVVIPFLQLESLTYNFGISENARQSATLRGDSLFYVQNSAFTEEFAGTNSANQVITLSNPAIVYKGDTTNGDRYALSVMLTSGKRLLYGTDYTESASGGGAGKTVTLTILSAVPTTDAIRVSYGSNQATTYPQLSHAAVTAVRPAAIRGRNVEVYIGGRTLSDRWTSIQSASLEYRVNLEKDEELGNSQVVSQTYDVPAVSGTIEVKPRDYADLYAKVCEVAGVTPGEVAGALTTDPLPLLIVLHSPDTGAILKTLDVPDARFSLPGYSGQAGQGQKMTQTFAYESDSGDCTIWKGAKP